MGMDADVIGIGKFSSDTAHLLDYSPDFYSDTKEGADVITTVFLAGTSDQSHQLARAMGVDPWDFNTHKINASKVSVFELRKFVEYSPDHEEKDIDGFIQLVEKGFTFFYRPNG
ncbi:MAG: hypothetical protein EHM49_03310 [Deltaproteobacteria bacterium]|nr:MAG: hypothetical protein EHM49_03310 [Deltaproteobacteria bacterium]